MSAQKHMKQFDQPRRTTPDEALTCPFCGEQPEIEWWHGGGPDKHAVICVSENCSARPMVSGETYIESLNHWNTRLPNEREHAMIWYEAVTPEVQTISNMLAGRLGLPTLDEYKTQAHFLRDVYSRVREAGALIQQAARALNDK